MIINEQSGTDILIELWERKALYNPSGKCTEKKETSNDVA